MCVIIPYFLLKFLLFKFLSLVCYYVICVFIVLPIGRSKFGLLPTPNPPIAQQQHALSTAQYMAMQQQQQQSYVMPAPAGVMIDSQSNVIPTVASTTNTHAHNQRELGPFQWMTPTVHVTATITYPGHFADGLYGNFLMQQCHNR